MLSKSAKCKINTIIVATLCVLFTQKGFAETPMAPSLIEPTLQQDNVKQNTENKSIKTNINKDVTTETVTVVDIISDKLQYVDSEKVYVATGNAEILLKEKGSRLTANKITFDPENNYVIAEDNVKMYKNGQIIRGSFVRLKMDEENIFVENPTTSINDVVMRARNADVYPKKIIGQKGSLRLTNKDVLIQIGNSAGFGIKEVPSLEANALELKQKPSFMIYSKRVDVKTNKYSTITVLNDSKVKIGKVTLFEIPYFEADNGKQEQQAETTIPELGTDPSLGFFLGAGPILHLPKGGTLKLLPSLAFGSGDVYSSQGDVKPGVGLRGRFLFRGNKTEFGYTTIKKKLAINGRQRLTPNTVINYGSYSYFENGFLGQRRPAYLTEVVNDKEVFSNKKFLIGLRSSFGVAKDLSTVSSYTTAKAQLQSNIMGKDPLYSIGNNIFQIRPNGQFLLSAYGNGDTYEMGRIGPMLSSNLGPLSLFANYFVGATRGHSAFEYDKYYEGHSNVRLSGTLKVCRFFDVGLYKSYNLDKQFVDNKMVEDRYSIRFGPDDMKITVGYDSKRKSSTFGLELLLGSGKTSLEYDKLNLVDTNK